MGQGRHTLTVNDALAPLIDCIMGSVNDDTTLLNIYYFRPDRINFLGDFSQIADLTV